MEEIIDDIISRGYILFFTADTIYAGKELSPGEIDPKDVIELKIKNKNLTRTLEDIQYIIIELEK